MQPILATPGDLPVGPGAHVEHLYGDWSREFTAGELEDLTDLASMVQRELELRLSSRRAVFER